MPDYTFDTAILFLVWCRPETTKKVLEKIREQKPKKLFVAADGPRGIPDEDRRIAEVRKVIEEGVDWECELQTLYREQNLGCRQAVAQAVDWFFDNVEEGIILEDDCVPHPSFFRYCQELLEKYRGSRQVMCISGENLQRGIKRGEASYYFSIFNHCWGWASWRRAWQYFDVDMKSWPEFREQNKLREIFPGDRAARVYWDEVFQKMHKREIDSWDYAWTYACWKQGGLATIPNTNLVSNIGFGEGAAHTTKENDARQAREVQALDFPLKHPDNIRADREADHVALRSRYVREPGRILIRDLVRKVGLLPLAQKVFRKIKKGK